MVLNHIAFCTHRVGDAVFGQGTGCLGTAVLVDARTVVPMPPNVSFTEAATVPTVFLTAYDCLCDVAKIGPTDCILIHAATGACVLVLALVRASQCIPSSHALCSQVAWAWRQSKLQQRQAP